MGENRERFLDIAKGIAIICIVLLHVEDGVIPTSLNTFIGSFMISMFYITTGWLDGYRREPLPLRELVRKRWQQLAVPYFWWSIIIFSFDLILYIFGYYDTYFIGRELYKTLTLRGIGTLWFLPALFGGEIIWNVIRRSRYPWVIGLLSLVATLMLEALYLHMFGGATDSITKIIEAPFRTIYNVLGAWPGIASGFLLHRLLVRLKWEHWSRWLYGFFGGLFTAFGYWCANYWPFSFCWRIAAPIMGPIGVLLLSMAMGNIRYANYFNYWGRNSMALMVTHYSIVMVICEIFNKFLFNEPYIHGYPAFIYFIAIMIVEYFICEIITRKFPILLGKSLQHYE